MRFMSKNVAPFVRFIGRGAQLAIRVMGACLVVVAVLLTPLDAQQPAKPEKLSSDYGEKKSATPGVPIVVSPRAMAIHRRSLVFDGHNDLPFKLRRDYEGDWRKLDISKLQGEVYTDIPRLRQGGVGAQFWSAYVPAETELEGTALRDTLEQIDVIHELARRWPDTFEIAQSADDVLRIWKSGKIASLIGLEGGHSIQNSIGALRQLYRLGARYMTLSHTDTNHWADSATDEPRHDGLAPFGEEVVREMNRLGMLVDISHISADAMRDALRVTQAPVIASHSSARAVADHPRNIPDDVLELVAANGGVVMVNFYSGYAVPESAKARSDIVEEIRRLKKLYPNPDEFDEAFGRWHEERDIVQGHISHVADHIDHIVRVAGIDHVGLGSDFDGVSLLPEGLEDVSSFPNLTQVLLDRGYDEEELQKILGLNALRVLRQAEEVAVRLRAAR
jgi:membrane dipeptidase